MRYGKITIGLILAIIIAMGITWTHIDRAGAATSELTDAQTFVLPSTPTVTHTANTYIILWDTATGHLVNDAGAIASGNTWTGGDIATAVHAQNGLAWTATIPILNVNHTYAMAIFDAASPAKTDVPTMGPFLYDPRENIVYSDTNPIHDKKVHNYNGY